LIVSFVRNNLSAGQDRSNKKRKKEEEKNNGEKRNAVIYLVKFTVKLKDRYAFSDKSLK